MDLAQQHDGGQGPMQLPISTPVAAMADDLAGRGLGPPPASIAKAASERNRPGWDQLTSSWAALIGPIPGWMSNAGATTMMSSRSSPSSRWAS
jgi:hypothetical protein